MAKFVFYSRSANVKPGKGKHEYADGDYPTLVACGAWRKMLSNFDTSGDFVWRGRTYRSVEHAFQGAKISLQDDTKGYLFCLESGSDISRGDGSVAQKNRKLVKLTPDNIRKWGDMSMNIMSDISRSKFDQCAEWRHMLHCTGDAELWHLSLQRGKPSTLIRFKHLEDLRTGSPSVQSQPQ